MSLKELKKDELVALAEQFGVASTGTKETIIAALAEEGVDEAYLAALAPGTAAGTPDPEPEPSGEETVVYFIGLGSYGSGPYRWTVKNPYQVVPVEFAATLIEKNPGGFRIASAEEIEAFYS